MGFIINLVIVLLVCGFIYMVWLKLSPWIAQFIAEPFMGLINILIWILIAGIILFYVIIPILQMLGHMPLSLPKWN